MKKKKSSAVWIAAISFYLLLPLVLTFFYSLFQQWGDILPSGFTPQYYFQLFSDARFLAALGRTLVISALPVLVCTAIVLLAMYSVVVYFPKLDRVLQILCMLPYAIQGVILAVSVLSLYADAPEPFSNRIVMLTGAYCIMILPYIYQSIKNSLSAVNAPRLMEAAEILGAGRFRAFFSVIVPNILAGILISMMLSLSIVFGDFIIVNTIGGSYYETAQMYLFKQMFISGPYSSAMIVVLFVATMLISAAIAGLRKKSSDSER